MMKRSIFISDHHLDTCCRQAKKRNWARSKFKFLKISHHLSAPPSYFVSEYTLIVVFLTFKIICSKIYLSLFPSNYAILTHCIEFSVSSPLPCFVLSYLFSHMLVSCTSRWGRDEGNFDVPQTYINNSSS